ncbi:MAG: hypothetical protein IANPNBLG_02881 [Bryobacteraceae bacterium]|nr:hypothetical protein [Bryobacteraceae bacterium]MCC6341880.1 hypothetical protein [Bryobacterales bacterium]
MRLLSIFSSMLQATAAKTPEAPGPDAKAIALIEKSGGSVRPLAQNDDRLEVSFYLQGPSIKDADVAPVATLHKVAILHLGNTAITGAALAYVKPLTDLEQLHLEKTRITGKDLANLKDLKKLTYLNLYGSGVDDAGLEQLAGLTNLKHLYVFQTKVTAAGIARLKQSLPNLEIVSGL